MKHCLVLLLLVSHSCIAQRWEADVMAGICGYNGDLTENFFSSRTIGPSVGVNMRYNFDDIFILRGGITYGSIRANDKYNDQPDLKQRNLNFQTNIWEASLCAEFNLFEPQYYTMYPYLYGGVGLFHFNPYTYDKDNKKTFLQPLGTEGQGLAQFPDKKPYSLTQFCVPVGVGLKISLNKKCDLAYEIGARITFTDYLDDVSTTYVSTQVFLDNNKIKTAELAYRQVNPPTPQNGDMRGNPKVKDWYLVSGFKLLIHLGKYKKIVH